MKQTFKLFSLIARNGAFLFLLLASAGIEAQGQDQSEGFRGNILAGISTTQISGDGFAGFDKLGLCSGIGVERKLAAKWSFALDITYINKGSRKMLVQARMISLII